MLGGTIPQLRNPPTALPRLGEFPLDHLGNAGFAGILGTEATGKHDVRPCGGMCICMLMSRSTASTSALKLALAIAQDLFDNSLPLHLSFIFLEELS